MRKQNFKNKKQIESGDRFNPLDNITYLPRCQHGNPLSDWSGEWLRPDCGCNFDNTSEHNQDVMAILKLKLGA